MQSLSSSRPCTAHFSGGNLLLLLLHCLLAKPQKYFILYYLKTAPFLPVSYPFLCSTWCLQRVTARAKSWAAPAPVGAELSALGTAPLPHHRALCTPGAASSAALRASCFCLTDPSNSTQNTKKYYLSFGVFKPRDTFFLAYKYYWVRCLNSCF